MISTCYALIYDIITVSRRITVILGVAESPSAEVFVGRPVRALGTHVPCVFRRASVERRTLPGANRHGGAKAARKRFPVRRAVGPKLRELDLAHRGVITVGPVDAAKNTRAVRSFHVRELAVHR